MRLQVTFSYPTRGKHVLKDVSFTVKAGQSVAFVGPSGSGKSTVVALLQRFYDPGHGIVSLRGSSLENGVVNFVLGVDFQIKVGGIVVKDMNIQWYREQIAIVSQEPRLFDGTVAQNILYGKPDASVEEMEDVGIVFVCEPSTCWAPTFTVIPGRQGSKCPRNHHDLPQEVRSGSGPSRFSSSVEGSGNELRLLEP